MLPISVWYRKNKYDILELYNNVLIKKIDCDFHTFVLYVYYLSV